MNTDRGLLFLTLSLVCFWLVFDDFFGKKRLSTLAGYMSPSIPSLGDAVKQVAEKENKKLATHRAKAAKKKKERVPVADDNLDKFYPMG